MVLLLVLLLLLCNLRLWRHGTMLLHPAPSFKGAGMCEAGKQGACHRLVRCEHVGHFHQYMRMLDRAPKLVKCVLALMPML